MQIGCKKQHQTPQCISPLLTMLFLLGVVHFPPTKYEEAILYPEAQRNERLSESAGHVEKRELLSMGGVVST